MSQAAAEALEPFRHYLLVLAKLHLDTRLRGKLDPADLVQQTLLRAYPALNQLRTREPAVVAAWLRRILARTLADTARHYDADKRAVDLERSLSADLDKSASGLADWIAADQTSPSERAERNEDLLRLADALAELPDAQREVVVLKHLQGKTLAEIAEATGRTIPAVVGLLRRGLEKLRENMNHETHETREKKPGY
jgi:RNA polymerase sigma-70 factor, ECF subfamily